MEIEEWIEELEEVLDVAEELMDIVEESDQRELMAERRQYKMMKRITVDDWDDFDFIFRFRISKATFHRVLEMVKPDLDYENPRSRYILPNVQLLIALRFYALGSTQLAVGDFSGVSITSVCRIIARVSDALARKAPLFIKMPQTEAEMRAMSEAFYQIAAFPRVIGALDCTHVKIQSPGGEHAELYRNRKTWFSLNVQTVADSQLKIRDIVARWPGSTHDSTIFNNSALKMTLESGVFRGYFILADSGYRNTSYLATPYLRADSPVKNLYNESQIRTRNVIERAYGVWKRRFPCLSLGLRIALEKVQPVVMACAVLHNIAIDENDHLPPVEVEGFEEALVPTAIPTIALAEGAPQQGMRGENQLARDFVCERHFAIL